jgi:hypothetical protein
VTKVLDGEDIAGKYRLRLFDVPSGEWMEICVDDLIPCDAKIDTPTPLFAKNFGAELYCMLIEKAFAKYAGSYGVLKGGAASRAWVAMTGCKDLMFYEFDDFKGEWTQAELDCSAESATRTNWGKQLRQPWQAGGNREPLPSLGSDEMFTLLAAHDANNFLMAASISAAGGGEHKRPDGLVEGHAYSLICVRELQLIDGSTLRLLELRNPWGNQQEWNGAWGDSSATWSDHPEVARQLFGKDKAAKADGLFWMTFEDFQQIFNGVEVCKKKMPTKRAAFDGSVAPRTLQLSTCVSDDGPVWHERQTVLGLVSLTTGLIAGDRLVADGASVEISVGEAGSRFVAVHCDTSIELDRTRQHATLSLGEVRAGTVVDILASVEVARLEGPQRGGAPLMEATLRYTVVDPEGHERATWRRHAGDEPDEDQEELSVCIKVDRPDEARPQIITSPKLFAHQSRVAAERAVASAVRFADDGMLADGRRALRVAMEAASRAAVADSPLVQRMLNVLGRSEGSAPQERQNTAGEEEYRGADQYFKRLILSRAYQLSTNTDARAHPHPRHAATQSLRQRGRVRAGERGVVTLPAIRNVRNVRNETPQPVPKPGKLPKFGAPLPKLRSVHTLRVADGEEGGEGDAAAASLKEQARIRAAAHSSIQSLMGKLSGLHESNNETFRIPVTGKA